jgi:hypothetical protein
MQMLDMAIAITQTELGAGDLREAAARRGLKLEHHNVVW